MLLFRTTKYYSSRHCEEQQWSLSNLTKYLACHANARSQRCHPPTSPNTAPATKNDMAKCHGNARKQMKHHLLQCMDDPRMIRERGMKPSVRNPPRTFWACHEHFLLKNATCHAPAFIQKSPSAAPATKSHT